MKRFHFGPGPMESIELSITATRPRATLARLLKARVAGTYRVYCGLGNEHVVQVDERHTMQRDQPHGDVEQAIAAAFGGDHDYARYVAEELVEWFLADWYDPCDSEEVA